MRTPTLIEYALGASAALLFLAGCSGADVRNGPSSGGSDLVVQQSFSRHPLGMPNVAMSYNALPPGIQARASSRLMSEAGYNACPASPLVFVSDPATPEIYIFIGGEKPGSFPCGAILGHGLVYPQGLDLDKQGRLYVANTFASNILIFPFPYVGVNPIVLPDPGQYPVGVEADCVHNLVYVTNFSTSSSPPGAGSLTKYTAGGVRTTYTDVNASREYFPTCDPRGAIYTTYSDVNGVGNVNKFPPGGGGAVITVGVPLQVPGGADYENGTLLVGDQKARTIIPCPGGLTPCGAAILLNQAIDPVTFDLAVDDEDFFTADNAIPGYQEYDYPTGLSDFSLTINAHPVIGVAVWPEDHP